MPDVAESYFRNRVYRLTSRSFCLAIAMGLALVGVLVNVSYDTTPRRVGFMAAFFIEVILFSLVSYNVGAAHECYSIAKGLAQAERLMAEKKCVECGIAGNVDPLTGRCRRSGRGFGQEA